MTEGVKLKARFFDDFNTNNNGFWDSTSQTIDYQKVKRNFKLIKSDYLSGEFQYCINNSGVERNWFILSDQRLIMVKVKGYEVADISYADLSIQQKDQFERQEIKLTRKQYQITLSTNDEELIKNWIKALKKICILTDYNNCYHTLKLIGKGSFAKVYLAQNRQTNCQYAMKSFSKESLRIQSKVFVDLYQYYEGKESLKNELDVLRKLNHPNVIKFYEIFETQSFIYFIMELITGGDVLRGIKNTNALTTPKFKTIIINMLKAIQYIHSQNCIHRDLKPENILIRNKDDISDIVIADFGLATFKVGNPLFKRCGTPGFVAPEILFYNDSMKFYDEKCDVYQLESSLLLAKIRVKYYQQIRFAKLILKIRIICTLLQCSRNFFLIYFKSAQIKDTLQLRLYRTHSLQILQTKKRLSINQISNEWRNGLQMRIQLFRSNQLFPYQQRSDQLPDSLQFQQRKPAINGETLTYENLSNQSNNSITSATSVKKADLLKLQRVSRFSQQRKIVEQVEQLDQGSRSPGKQQKTQKSDQLHKLAIQNSFRIKMKTADFYQEEKLQRFDDLLIDEENSDVEALIRRANLFEKKGSQLFAINHEGTSNSPMIFTPRAKKASFQFK